MAGENGDEIEWAEIRMPQVCPAEDPVGRFVAALAMAASDLGVAIRWSLSPGPSGEPEVFDPENLEAYWYGMRAVSGHTLEIASHVQKALARNEKALSDFVARIPRFAELWDNVRPVLRDKERGSLGWRMRRLRESHWHYPDPLTEDVIARGGDDRLRSALNVLEDNEASGLVGQGRSLKDIRLPCVVHVTAAIALPPDDASRDEDVALSELVAGVGDAGLAALHLAKEALATWFSTAPKEAIKPWSDPRTASEVRPAADRSPD